MPSPSSDPSYYKSSIFWLFLAPGLGGFLFGYDIGGTSYAILQLASLDTASVLSLSDAPLKTGWFVSAPSVGALLGTAFLVYVDQNWKKSSNSDHSNTNSNRNKHKPSKHWLSPIGRKTELLCAGVLYAVGGCLQYVSSLAFLPSVSEFAVVVLGRWIYGAGIGFAMHGGPTYLAETTPPSVRGMVVGAKEIAIVSGILCGYVVGNNLCGADSDSKDNNNNNSNDNNGWAKVYGLAVVGAISMIAFSKTIPESARYLVCGNHHSVVYDAWSSKNNSGGEIETDSETIEAETKQQISSEVLESLRFVWHPKRAQEEHSKLMEVYSKHNHHHHQQQHPQDTIDRESQSPQQTSSQQSQSLASLLSDPSLRPALKAGLGLVILQQITGQPSVLSYATPILARVPGLGASASVLLAVFKVLATSVSVVLVERNGRKTLLQAGCSLMLVALAVLVVAFREPSASGGASSDAATETATESLDTASVFALLGMFAYIAGYQIGFGPITWLMISEVFPQHVRGTTVALAVQANFALNALVQMLVPILQTTLGMSWTFFVFGCLTLYSLWFIRHSVPETRGLTLEEIEEKLASLVEVVANNNANSASAVTATSSNNSQIKPEPETTARRRKGQAAQQQSIEDAEDDEQIRLLP